MLIQHSKKFLILGFGLMLLSILSILIFKLNLSIDFKGGLLAEYSFKEEIVLDSATNSLKAELPYAIVQKTDNNSLIIKIKANNLDDSRQQILSIFKENSIEDFEEIRFDEISPSFSNELFKKAITASLISFVFMVFFVSLVFASATTQSLHSFHYGISALIALFFDILIPLGLFAFLSNFFLDYEINSYFIAAILAIIGFSVNDTIVVFDRIRENLKSKTKEIIEKEFPKIINFSIMQSLRRSFITSLTSFITLFILFFIMPAIVKPFIFILILGVIFGTFSSLFFAPFVLLLFFKPSKVAKANTENH